MGDRVIIVCHAGPGDIAPAIYGHWAGHNAPERIVEAGKLGILRRGDPSYAAARLCWHMIQSSGDTSSALGYGLLSSPEDLEPETLEQESHGDAGVILLDVRDGSLAYHGGYLAALADEIERPTHVKMKAE